MKKQNSDYEKYTSLKQNMQLPLKIAELLEFQQYSIRNHSKNQPNPFLCCARVKIKKFDVDELFQKSFNNLEYAQKQEYYINCMQYLDALQNKNYKMQIFIPQQNHSFNVQVHKGPFNNWSKCLIVPLHKELKIKVSVVDQQPQTIDLRDYILRKSKEVQEFAFVLEAIKPRLKSKYKFRCIIELNLNSCYNYLKLMFNKAHREQIDEQYKQIKGLRDSTAAKTDNLESIDKKLRLETQPNLFVDMVLHYTHEDVIDRIQQQNNIIENILTSRLKPGAEIKNLEEKKKINIFKKLVPGYNVDKLRDETQFRTVQSNIFYKILINTKNNNMMKLIFNSAHPKPLLIEAILDILNYPKWNESVEAGNIKIRITSQNSLIVYQKHKAVQKHSRDYLFLRHLCNNEKTTYIVDKSIQNPNYPIFTEISRDQMVYGVWCLRESQGQTELIYEVCFQNKNTNLKEEQIEEQNVVYLRNISNLEHYLQSYKLNHQQRYLNLNWGLENNSYAYILQYKESASLFSENLCSEIVQSGEVFYTIREQSEIMSIKNKAKKTNRLYEIEEISEETSKQQFNQTTGRIILPDQYLRRFHVMVPKKKSTYKQLESNYLKHYLWKDIWSISSDGGLHCKNESMLQKQHLIFQDLNKFYKNLTKNKSIFNISLPIECLSEFSITQQTARTLCLAPLILQKASKQQNPVERFKYAMIFGLSKGLMNISMQKTFNGLLGQTYQGWTNGCPIYCEQISIHPAITYFYLHGRGYKVYGSLQAKVDLNMNSALGIDQGQTVIVFDRYPDQKIHIKPHGAEVTGLLAGQRRLTFRGKSYFVDESNRLYGELNFDQEQKNIFSGVTECHDKIRGSISKVNQKFINKFRKATNKFSPEQDMIEESLVEIGGRWTDGLIFDKIQYYNINKDIPAALESDYYPLNSDCNYREDIYYRRKHNYVRCQIQKERLENLQRNDRKLRYKKTIEAQN